MDPLNTLWLAPVGSAIVGAPLFRYQAAPPMVMAARCAGLPLREASARRGDGTYPSPGGCTVCFAALDCIEESVVVVALIIPVFVHDSELIV